MNREEQKRVLRLEEKIARLEGMVISLEEKLEEKTFPRFLVTLKSPRLDTFNRSEIERACGKFEWTNIERIESNDRRYPESSYVFTFNSEVDRDAMCEDKEFNDKYKIQVLKFWATK